MNQSINCPELVCYGNALGGSGSAARLGALLGGAGDPHGPGRRGPRRPRRAGGRRPGLRALVLLDYAVLKEDTLCLILGNKDLMRNYAVNYPRN
jgi:hypothetical protein